MVNVVSVMKKPIVVNENSNIREVIKSFRKHKISGAPVVDNDRNLVGIISESDIIKTLTTHSEGFDIILPSPFDLIELPLKTTLKIEEFREDIEKALKTKVKDIMTKDVITISPETSINEAAEIMIKNKIKRLPVVKNRELVGIITRGDLIEALI
ncbi:CBS domain-containing protein [Methanothermococcus sp.]|uniref:CBS domain-containing protein n=1 Tax=Methanothermococcus sp. TaxID=2614238 RepID=UPI0025E60E6A|nr:CBS domain-containing protein [Methanothermococcus sp.]